MQRLNRRSERTCNLSTNPRLYGRPFPFYGELKQIGSLSLDGRRQFHNDDHQLRRYVPPANLNSCYFDLRHGYDKMIKKDEFVNEYIDCLLRWVLENKHKVSQANQPLFKSLNTDFFCRRGLLTKLLCLPYENRADLLIAIIKFRGTYFLCEFDTEARMLEKMEATEKDQEMCAWGFKFEQYVTCGMDQDHPDPRQPVNNKACYWAVVRSRLETHSILFGAEVDCKDLNCDYKNKYVELKTSRIWDNVRQESNFYRFKLIKWWAQSYLLGLPRVVGGFRDDNGAVRHLKEFLVKDMPVLTWEKTSQPWEAPVCFNFLDTVLTFIKSHIETDNERAVYLLRWKPESHMTLEFDGTHSNYHFLPDWFIHWDAWDKPFED